MYDFVLICSNIASLLSSKLREVTPYFFDPYGPSTFRSRPLHPYTDRRHQPHTLRSVQTHLYYHVIQHSIRTYTTTHIHVHIPAECSRRKSTCLHIRINILCTATFITRQTTHDLPIGALQVLTSRICHLGASPTFRTHRIACVCSE